MNKMKRDYLAKKIEPALLKPETTIDQVLDMCKKAKKYKFGGVVVNPNYLRIVSNELKNYKDIYIVSVVDFPFGSSDRDSKVLQSAEAWLNGANHIDVVMNIGLLKSKDYKRLAHEIHEIKDNVKWPTLKIIIETALLTNKEIKKATELCMEHGADYIKTNTGFFPRAKNEKKSFEKLISHLKIIKKVVTKYNKKHGTDVKIKASGGIRTLDHLLQLEKLGIDKYGIGLEKAVKILDNLEE